jgi:RES domain-containing protein
VRRLRRGGRLLRVADPDWEDPLDGRYAGERGGRWNPRGSFPVVYLCASLAVARANVFRALTGLPYGPEDIEPERGPVLVEAEVPENRYVDAVTRRGLESLGLPATYPRTASGKPVARRRCQASGRVAWDAGKPGIACFSAAPTAPAGGEELAWFARGRRLRAERTEPFERWFW